MKGLWKENLGGWNAKDTKRKKQSRNHTLKDNGTYIIRTFDGYRDKNRKVNSDIFRYETETVLVEKAIERKNKVIIKDYDKDGSFIYNKPLSSWKRMTFFNDGKRRKIAQKHAHSMDRQNIRKWIHDEDWDAEVKTHALSKSIAWEIW